MNMLAQSQRKWRRTALLSKGTTGDCRWKGRGPSRPPPRQAAAPRSIVPTVTDDDEPRRGKENDGPPGANGGSIITRSGGDIAKGTGRTASNSNKIYIGAATLRAMKKEAESLPLPASLTSVCLALETSIPVLDAHADADYAFQTGGDDADMKKLEIMGAEFGEIALSPTQKRHRRKREFQSACMSVASRGTKIMLTTWEEAEGELAEVFTFAAVDIAASTEPRAPPAAAGGEGSKSARKGRLTPPKRTPKRAHRRTPKKKRGLGDILEVAAKKVHDAMNDPPSFLTVESFREVIRKRMGEETFRQVLNQTKLVATKKPSRLDAAAARLDEKIQEKELERRSEARVAEVLAAKEKADREREAKEAASKLMRPLTAEEQQIVNGAIKGIGPPAEILARQDADSVQRASMQTLRNGQWLNDEVINYFLKNCLAKRDENLCQKHPGRKRSHFFNSFFVQTMFDEKNNDPTKRGVYNYKNVRRWSKKVPGKDIFNLRYIVCPINLDNLHWTSAVIFMEEKRIQYYDSMGGTIMAKLEGLLRYLQDEWRAKKGGEMDVAEWELVGCTSDTPQQRNGFDCGVFTCMFADFVSKDCPLVFSQEHINQCRERIALSIMKNCAIE